LVLTYNWAVVSLSFLSTTAHVASVIAPSVANLKVSSPYKARERLVLISI